MTITKELKNRFISFCQTEFPNKKYCANETNKTQWIYVQAGNIFGNSLHYEFGGNEVQLHIEIPAGSGIQKYLTQYSICPDYEWVKWQNKKNHCCILKRSVANVEDMFNVFKEIKEYFEPIIIEYEMQQSFANSTQPTMDENKINVELCTKTLSEIFRIKTEQVEDVEYNYNKDLKLPLNIPDYQRAYEWKTDHVKNLLNDLFEASKKNKSYLLGTIILHETELAFEIVDGQQRLITLTILIYLLNNKSISDQLTLLESTFNNEKSFFYIKNTKAQLNSLLNGKGEEQKKHL